MFDKLKKISAVEHLRISSDSAIMRMKLDGRMTRGYLCTLSLVLAVFIDSIDNFPLDTVRHITLLLAACPEIHDHALQLIPDGGWLCCYYDKNMSAEKMAVEIEKHLALTRYLANIIVCQKKTARCESNMRIKRMVVFPALFFCLCAHAQTLAWKGADFSLRARKISLAAVLQNLAENYDTPVVIDPAIVETFSGAIPPASPVAILNRLTTQYNLVTWLDGNTLFVYPSSRVVHRVITLNTLPASTFIRFLRKRDVPEKSSCEARVIPGVNAIDISGVPACIARITQLASMLDGEMTRRRDDAVSLVVYPLKYATAVDDHYQYRDQNVVVPGIVSVLRDMSRGSTPTASGSSAATQGLPMFSADPRQNAVIVRDRSVNMAGYRKLIGELDRRPQMIEISVTIIDVDAGDVSQLGIDWSAALSLGGGSISFNGPDVNAGGGFSTVISNTPSFMARLVALEKNSHAYILSQPSVVTLNNIQAVLDKNITFYTKLQGDKVAKLESITTGSLLRVTPRLLEEQGKQNIMLSLNIQDGQQNPPLSQNEPLPEVQNSEIASQATLHPGQSLLLGGFKQDKQMQAQNKIPLLGDIPIIGHLFRSDLNQTHSVIRLFLIKATVANSDSSHG